MIAPAFGLAIASLLAVSCVAADVTLTIDPTADKHPISRFIYGANADLNQPAYADLNLTLARMGGNRWTAYNWTTNASNAGNDYHYSNDSYMDSSKEPGHAVRSVLDADAGHDAATIVTVPTNGYLSADESGFVPENVPPQDSPHFVPEYPSASADPKPAPGHIYQDQFVRWIKTNYAGGFAANTTRPIFFMLDNEPDLWSSTHVEVHPQKPTYAEMIQRSAAYAAAIKKVTPNTLVFGPASFGWSGFISLQEAVDSKSNNAAINPATGKAYGDFLSYYLAQMKVEEGRANRRLLDVLDVHWYPEALGTDASGKQIKIIEKDASPDVAQARVNAPRSLWDPSYVEKSWITQWSTQNKPILLLPRLNDQINTNYPGTKLSVSEYNYGGGEDISGAIAEADVLGLLGKYNVFAACEWPLGSNEKFILGAMRLFRNYDGRGGAFGDTSVDAQSNNPADVSVYASVNSTGDRHLVLVAVNHTLSEVTTNISVKNVGAMFTSFTVYQLTSKSSATKDGQNMLPTLAGTFPSKNLAAFVLPAQSVNTIVLNRLR